MPKKGSHTPLPPIGDPTDPDQSVCLPAAFPGVDAHQEL